MAEKIYSEVLARAPFLREPVIRFLDRLARLCEEMEAARAGGRLREVKELAHQLKGAGGTHGYQIVSDYCAAIERAAGADDQARTEELMRELAAVSQRLVPEPPP
jgi:HPt (histidine-containing phosphotransfer) domain-containing protein